MYCLEIAGFVALINSKNQVCNRRFLLVQFRAVAVRSYPGCSAHCHGHLLLWNANAQLVAFNACASFDS